MAINPDAIPSNEQIQETFLDQIYYPYEKQIWSAGILLALIVLGFLGMREWDKRREDAMWDRYYRIVDAPVAGAGGDTDKVESLRALLREFPDESVSPHALRDIAFAHQRAKRWDEARAAFEELRKNHPDYDLFNISSGGADGKQQSLADYHQEVIEKEVQWQEDSTYVPHDPPSDLLALVETNLGNLWIGFYRDLAPKHVAAFVARAKRGDFNQTQFYETRHGTDGRHELLLAGSTASRDWTDPVEHDRDTAMATISPEAGRFKLRHTHRIVSAVKMPSGESSEAFMIVTDKKGFRRYDGDTTPFGAVIEREGSLETLEKIGSATTYGQNPVTKDLQGILSVRQHPYPYVYIRRVSIWKDEKLESGHVWDSTGARIASKTPEAWEADAPEPWKPEPVKKQEPDDEDKKDDSKEDASDAPGPDDEPEDSDGDKPEESPAPAKSPDDTKSDD